MVVKVSTKKIKCISKYVLTDQKKEKVSQFRLFFAFTKNKKLYSFGLHFLEANNIFNLKIKKLPLSLSNPPVDHWLRVSASSSNTNT